MAKSVLSQIEDLKSQVNYEAIIADTVEELKKKKKRRAPKAICEQGETIVLQNGSVYHPSVETVKMAMEVVYPFIVNFYIGHGATPTLRDLSDGLEIKSDDKIRKLIQILVYKGLISRKANGEITILGPLDSSAIDVMQRITEQDIVGDLSKALSPSKFNLIMSAMKIAAASSWMHYDQVPN